MISRHHRSLILAILTAVLCLAAISAQAQDRPRQVGKSPKNDPQLIISETRPRRAKGPAPNTVTKKAQPPRATVEQARQFLNQLYRLVDRYMQNAQYGPPY